MNPILGKTNSTTGVAVVAPLNVIDHAYFNTNRMMMNLCDRWSISSSQLSNSIVHKMWGLWTIGEPFGDMLFDTVLVDAPITYPYQQTFFLNFGGYYISPVLNTVFLQDSANNSRTVVKVFQSAEAHNNAFLSRLWYPAPSFWMGFDASNLSRGSISSLTDNYWGTSPSTLIDAMIYDYNDNFNIGRIDYQPIQTTPVTTTFPFVADLVLSTTNNPDAHIISSEPVTFTVAFNRNMDMSIQPAVSFGPDIPITDYTIHPINGGWQDTRTWKGTFNVNPITGDGYQLIRVAGAVAADDPWLVTGDDAGRFRFEIITSGTEAMNLQATGGEGYIDLMWTQDDFDLLAGYNLYRSTSQDGAYNRINSSIIPPDEHTWRDTDVIPGQPYYYYFKVVKSDMSESAQSNIAAATPIDTIQPVITHTPITEAAPGLPLTISADVTDNVGVQSVTLYYRHMGDTTYASRAMAHTTGNRYTATLEGSLLSSPGLDYYIHAGDGVGAALSGRPEFPHQVTVVDRPVVTLATPNHGPTSGGTPVTISGSNFKDGATVTFGGAAASNVSVVSSSQITCDTPPHFPETADIRVTNPDAQSGTLLRGFTYESDIASIGMPDTGGGQNEIVQVPVNLANVQGMAAASFTVNFDNNVLHATGAQLGNLTPGWSLASNTSNPGQIRISMASPGGTTTGSGALVYIDFEVVGAPGTSSTLSLSNILLNDGAIPVETADGSFNVDLVYAVSGTIQFWNGGVVSDTLLTLEGDRVYSDLSSSDGTYQVSGAAAGDYILTPEKTSETNGISAYDASLALQHDAGLITLNGHAATAADVNKNGTISSMDAFYILQESIDLISLPFPGAGEVWSFSPSTRSYTDLNSDLTDQDFQVILLGDPSGNWAASSAPQMSPTPNLPESGSATLSLPSMDVLPGETFTVPLSIDLDSGQVYGADFEITYDPDVVTPTQVLKGSLTSGWGMASNLNTPGLIRVAMAGAIPVTSDGEMLRIVFDASDTAGLSADLNLTRGDLNEGDVTSVLQSGHVNIAHPVQADFSASPTSGPAPLTVAFTNLSTGDFTDVLWYFGDGTTSALAAPSHEFSTPGTYTVTLTASGPGGSDSMEKSGYIHAFSLSISGQALYWANAAGLPGVDFNLSGDHTDSAASNSSGLFTIPDILAGSYTLVPEKNDDVNGITAYDASLVLQHVAGLNTLTGYPAIAADIDLSSAVGTMDASYILQKAVGLIDTPFPGASASWEFDPSNRAYANLTANQTGQDFTGILLGDPSGNWEIAGAPDRISQPGSTAKLSFQTGIPDPTGLMTASILLDSAGAQVFSLDLAIDYDSSKAQLVSAAAGQTLADWMFAKNTQNDGEIRLGLADSNFITEKIKVINLVFQLSGGAESIPLHFSTGLLNEGKIPVELEDILIDRISIFLPIVIR